MRHDSASRSKRPKGPCAWKAITLGVLETLTGGREPQRLNFRLWDGSCWPNADPKPATLVLNRPSALKEMLSAGTETGVAEAYIYGAIEVLGDFEAAFEWADLLIEHTRGWTRKLEIGHLLSRLPDPEGFQCDDISFAAEALGQEHSLKRDRAAVRFHYDLSDDFYRLWLDPRMVYSCAYFHDRRDGLEAAQLRKLDIICRKLNLKPGDRLLDIGCGWGGLLLHAAKRYGIEGEGITLSERQADFAQKRVFESDLQERVFIRVQDYRELDAWESYDAIVSVGMVEHVGRKGMAGYFNRATRLLKPGGLFLNHGIGLGPLPLPARSGTFIAKYVFPDFELLPLDEMLHFAGVAQLETRDVESLREHYALTLDHWRSRLEQNHQASLDYVSEPVYRAWRLYLAGSAHGFRMGQLSVYQTLLAKLHSHGSSRAPLTREGWYRNGYAHDRENAFNPTKLENAL